MEKIKLLFFGDSLTDMGRLRDKDVEKADIYGTGFVFDIASQLMFEEPGKYKIINRGNSGNKVTDLFNRFKEDVISEKPDVLTILIGVNDVWHGINNLELGTPINKFEDIYKKMIMDIKNKLPDIKIILMEPFFLKGDATNDAFEEFKKVYNYAKVVEKIANDSNSIFIPLQKEFDKKAKGNEIQFLYDGVHTNPGGAYLIAKKWLESFKKIGI